MYLLLDLFVLAIVIFFVLIYAKKGFVKSVFSIASFIVAIFLAFYLSGPLADFTYSKTIEPGVITSIDKILSAPGATIENASNEIWEALPDIIKNNASALNISPETILSSENTLGDTISMAQNISDSMIKPFTVYFLKLIYSLILFAVLSFLFKFVVKVLNRIFSFSIIGNMNSVLGALLGVIMGVIAAFIFIIVVNFIVSVSGGFLFFTKETIDSSNIFKFIMGFLPIKF